MSRCFPYPPPGYERVGFSHEALIESIKREEKVKKEKKEKKEKKRERQKEKSRKHGDDEKKRHSHKKRRKGERSQDDHKGQEQKRGKDETEQLEKSSLTEEHGHPLASQTLCDSFDSSLNSESRQTQHSPSDGRRNTGSIIKIRFPTHRPNESEVPPPCKQQPCSVRGSTDYHLQKKVKTAPRLAEDNEQRCSTSAIDRQNFDSNLRKEKSSCLSVGAAENVNQKAQTLASKEQPCSVSGSSDHLLQKKIEPAPRLAEKIEQPCSTSAAANQNIDSNLREKKSSCPSSRAAEKLHRKAQTVPSSSPKLSSVDLRLRDLIENWVPLHQPPNFSTDLGDQEWLFPEKRDHNLGLVRPIAGSNNGSSRQCSTPCPGVCYLPEADIYALPYTVPF